MKMRTQFRYLEALVAALPDPGDNARTLEIYPALAGIHVADPETWVVAGPRIMAIVDVHPDVEGAPFEPFTFYPLGFPPLTPPGATVILDTANRTMTLGGSGICRQCELIPHPYIDWKGLWANALKPNPGVWMPDVLSIETEQLSRLSLALQPTVGTPCEIRFRGEGKPLELHWVSCPDFRAIVPAFEPTREESRNGS